MSDATEVLTVQEGQAAVKQVAVSGEIISLPSATDVKAIVQTDDGPVAAVKTVSLGGGSASGNFVEQLSTMPEASTKQGKIVQYVGTETGAYNHGAFYESVEQAGGTNSYSDFDYARETDVTDTDILFDFVNAALQSGGQSPLAVGDSVAIGLWRTTDLEYEEKEGLNYVQRTSPAGVSPIVEVTDEWLDANYPDGYGLDMAGVPECVTFTVTGVAATSYVWQETTVDKLLEEMVENNASVLSTTTSLNPSKGGSKSVTLSTITAFSSLDSRPSHKAPGAIVINDTQDQIGIITEVNSRNATVVTVFTGFTGTGVPSGAGSYKFLGSESSSTAKWIYGLVLADIYANETMASTNYFGDRPFMSKTGAYETTKFQTYIVKSVSSPASFTLNSDTSNGQIVITDAAMLFAEIKRMWIDSYGGYGSITQIEPGQTITLTFNVDDYYGPTMLQYNMEVYISNPSTGDSFTGNSIYVTSSDMSMMGLTSTLTAGGMYTMELTVGSVGGSGYLYESQGCAKIQAATADNPTYAFSMPGNMAQMGGIIDLPSMGPGVAVENNPVQLPRALANADYVVQLTVITESGFQQVVVDASHRTTTGFDVCARNNDTAATVTGAKVAWTVVGIMPMTLFSGMA